jgi:two-component system nitrogen regulation response regulator NtrX
MERLLILATGDPSEPVTADMLPSEVARARVERIRAPEQIIALPLREARELFEREYLTAQILRFGGNISRRRASSAWSARRCTEAEVAGRASGDGVDELEEE